MIAVLLTGFVALTSPDPASANHHKKGSKVSVVADEFNLEEGRTVPPLQITCLWSDEYETYNCQGENFNEPLTNKSQDVTTDYLQRGADYGGGGVVNPHKFSCDQMPPKDPSNIKPSDYKCSDSDHEFSLSRMVYVTSPKNCDSSSPECIEFVLPPRK
jgi:hypothetical protein